MAMAILIEVSVSPINVAFFQGMLYEPLICDTNSSETNKSYTAKDRGYQDPFKICHRVP